MHKQDNSQGTCCGLGWGDACSPESSCISIAPHRSPIPIVVLGGWRGGEAAVARCGSAVQPSAAPCHAVASDFKELLGNGGT